MSKLKKCRVCGNKELFKVIDLGSQYLSGIFPKDNNEDISCGELSLVLCSEKGCGLLQLEQTFNPTEMYGDNYGYRSGLNETMVKHLKSKVDYIQNSFEIIQNDLVLDIGSNDGTTLNFYTKKDIIKVGFDPSGDKFKENYLPGTILISDFFSSSLFRQKFKEKKAKVITSFSMFYDLEDPLRFMQDIFDILDEDGVWIFEQSYMPLMLQNNSYDTICHEHIEYYSISQIKWMADKIGLNILDINFNKINGGSFSVTIGKKLTTKPYIKLNELINIEKEYNLNDRETYKKFQARINESKHQLREFIHIAKKNSKKIMALGASTKGNTILQYCGLSRDDISYIGEVNPNKYGCYTPGSKIPIIPEQEVINKKPDYLIILPWHFKDFFTKKIKYHRNTQLVFPLPEFQIVNPENTYEL